jgi:phosphomevalonate kinase
MTKEVGDHSSESEENKLGKALQEWWDSDACKELQKKNEEAKQRAIGKYFMLSEEDKLDMVQAICYIMCKAEKEGTSHRGLQDSLGIYPAGFWVDHLMDIHNALWTYYNDKK